MKARDLVPGLRCNDPARPLKGPRRECRYDSPLQPLTSRLLHVGDSAGNRSALSFAGASIGAAYLRRNEMIQWVSGIVEVARSWKSIMSFAPSCR